MPVTSALSINSPLSSSITPSLFHCRLKNLFLSQIFPILTDSWLFTIFWAYPFFGFMWQIKLVSMSFWSHVNLSLLFSVFHNLLMVAGICYVKDQATSCSLGLSEPFASTAFAKRAFLCSAPATWNSLPRTVTDNDSLGTFKSRLKTFLFSLAFNWHWHYCRQHLWSHDQWRYTNLLLLLLLLLLTFYLMLP